MRVGVVLQDPVRKPTGLDVYTRNLWDALEDLGCGFDLVPLTLPARWAGTAYLRVLWEQLYLPLWAYRHRIDLLHVPAGTVPVLWRRPCVMTLHDLGYPAARPYDGSLGPRLYFGRAVPASARFATAIMADSEATKRDAVTRLGIPEERISVVPLAAPPDFRRLPRSAVSAVRKRYGLKNRYLLQVGAPVPRKNLSGSLRGFARFLARSPDVQVDFVVVGGDGGPLPEVPTEALPLMSEGRIRRLGFVSQEDLVALYNGALAVVVPSFYEGFGLPVLEAFACGTPAISSDVASLPEVAGSAALYVDPGDPETIAEAMEQYARSPSLRSRMRRRALRRSAHFTWRRTAEQTHDVYGSALRRRERSSEAEGQPGPKVLFVRLDRLGDVVLTTPCFEAIKRRYPGARVDVVVQPTTAPVLEGDRRVDRVFTFAAPWHASWRAGALADAARVVRRLRRERYDVVITLRRDLDDALFARLCGGRRTVGFYSRRTRPLLSEWVRFQPHLHTAENQLRLMSLLGCEANGITPDISCQVDDPREVEALLAGASAGRPLIGVAPFASAEAKALDAARAAALIEQLAATLRAQPVLLGGREDSAKAANVLRQTAAPVIDLVGRTSIPALCDVLRRCALLVCVDSGPMHLAAALSTPIVALFGDENPALWGPYGSSPCRVLQGGGTDGQPRLDSIPDAAVLAAAGELLDASAVPPAARRRGKKAA